MMRQPQMAPVSRPMCPRLKKLNHISRLITMHNARKLELGEPISPRQLVDAILSARFMDEFNSDSKSTDGAKSRLTRSSTTTPRDLRNSFNPSPKRISPRLWIKGKDMDSKSPSSLLMSSGGASSPSNSSISLISRAPSGDCKMRLSYQDDNWLSWSEDDVETLSPCNASKGSPKCLANPIDKLQEIQQELLQAEEFLQFEDDSRMAASENERAYLIWLSKKSNVRRLNLNGKEEKIKVKKAVSQILKEVAEKKYTVPPVPSYDEWRKQKSEEMRAVKMKEERERKKEQARKAKRIALNEAAFAKWYQESRDKPKPLPVISATRLCKLRQHSEMENIRSELSALRTHTMASANRSQSMPRLSSALSSLPSITNPTRVKKLTKFFGDEPPLLRLFLKKLGYEKYASVFESEQVGMVELPYMSEDRLQSMGIPLGPRLRILQEAHVSVLTNDQLCVI